LPAGTDPVRRGGVRQRGTTSICLTSRYIVMDHFEDEGQHQDYIGMHQWNLQAEGGRPSLWNESERYDLAQLLGGSCEVHAANANGTLHVEIRKLPATSAGT
jgi:hypothetical protein